MQYSFITEEKPQDVFENFNVVEHKRSRGGSRGGSRSGSRGGSRGGSNIGNNTTTTARNNTNPPKQVPVSGPGSYAYKYNASEETICRSQRHSTENRNYKNCRDRDCDIYNIHCPLVQNTNDNKGGGILNIILIILGSLVSFITVAIIIGSHLAKSNGQNIQNN